MSDISVQIKNLSKKYFLGNFGFKSLKYNLLSRFFKNLENPNKKIYALKDINMEVKKGEAIAILGKNGSGKSTLMKILSKLSAHDDGEMSINGKLIPMLHMNAGIQVEATGRENIFFIGSIMRAKRKELKEKINEIAEFSGLTNFLDTPVKKYSSGMLTKLYFSVMIILDFDILICDEIMAVSDSQFKSKCIKKIIELKNKKKTIIFISHEKEIVNAVCDFGFVFTENGNLSQKLSISDAYALYEKNF
tara:strand:- start:880 stop:1623 length:744 start_codon:yes stop_codon:yes gene_type:complete